MKALRLAPAEFARFGRILAGGKGERTVLILSYHRVVLMVELPERWAKPNPKHLSDDGRVLRRKFSMGPKWRRCTNDCDHTAADHERLPDETVDAVIYTRYGACAACGCARFTDEDQP